MRSRPPVLIVGASMSGLRTAESLRRFGYDGPITLLGKEPHPPYNRPPLSKDVLIGGVSHEGVAFPRRAALDDARWILGSGAVSADLEERTVRASDGQSLEYTALVIATGLRPRRLAGSLTLPGRFPLRTLDDAIALRSALRPTTRVAIVGAGFIGCEVAASARVLGCDVTVIGSQALPMLAPLGAPLAADLMRRHQREGVRFRMGTRVRTLIGVDRVHGLELDNGETIDADVVVEAVGSDYNTEWLDGNDLDLTAGVLTDDALRGIRRDGSSWRDVYAVGDIARFPNRRFSDTPRTVEHWNIPTETARRAARVIAADLNGDESELVHVVSNPFQPVPSFWSDQYDIHLLAFGLLDLADEIRLLEGSAGSDCVYGYYRSGQLVGVCGIGFHSVIQGFRNTVGSQDLPREVPA